MSPDNLVKHNLIRMFEMLCIPKLKDTFIDDMKTRHYGLFNSESSLPYLNGIFQDTKLDEEYFLQKLESKSKYFEIMGLPFTYHLNDSWEIDYEHEELQKKDFTFGGTFLGKYLDLSDFQECQQKLPEGYTIGKVDAVAKFSEYRYLVNLAFLEGKISLVNLHHLSFFLFEHFDSYVIWDENHYAVAGLAVLTHENSISLCFSALSSSNNDMDLFGYLLSYVLKTYKDLNYEHATCFPEMNAIAVGSLKAAGFETVQKFYVYVRQP